MTTSPDPEKIRDIIRRYKYDNKHLEKTIAEIFSLSDIEPVTLHNVENEKAIQEFAWLLVDYKFNKIINVQVLIASMIAWMNSNGSKLKSYKSWVVPDDDDDDRFP